MPQRAVAQAADVMALPTVDGQMVTGACVLMGVLLTDEAGGNVKIHLHNGTADTAPHVAAAAVSANGVESHWFGPNGISCPGGIYLDVMSGTPSGSIFYHLA